MSAVEDVYGRDWALPQNGLTRHPVLPSLVKRRGPPLLLTTVRLQIRLL